MVWTTGKNVMPWREFTDHGSQFTDGRSKGKRLVGSLESVGDKIFKSSNTELHREKGVSQRNSNNAFLCDTQSSPCNSVKLDFKIFPLKQFPNEP